MTQPTQMHDIFSQFTGKGVEALSLWAELNQTVVRQLVAFSAGTAKEGLRLYTEIQLAAVDALKDGQTFLLRRQADFQDAARDPIGVYQRSVVEWVEGTQRTFKLFESTAQAVTRSAERVQQTAEHTARDIQAGFAHWSDEIRSLYAGSPQPREARVRGQKAEAA